jgi:hypothetical protein
MVRSATAQVAIESRTDIRFGWGGIAVQQGLRDHDHARNAITTLSGLLVDKGLLKLIRLAVLHESGQRRDGATDGRLSGGLAGSDRLAVDKDGTCTALRQAAAEFGAVLIKVIVEDEEERSFSRCIDGNVLSIKLETEHHDPPWKNSSRGRCIHLSRWRWITHQANEYN